MTTIKVDGCIYTDGTMKIKPIRARFTSDRNGETLSLSDNDETVQITIAFKAIEEIIKHERKMGVK